MYRKMLSLLRFGIRFAAKRLGSNKSGADIGMSQKKIIDNHYYGKEKISKILLQIAPPVMLAIAIDAANCTQGNW